MTEQEIVEHDDLMPRGAERLGAMAADIAAPPVIRMRAIYGGICLVDALAVKVGSETPAQPPVNNLERDHRLGKQSLKGIVPACPAVQQAALEDERVTKDQERRRTSRPAGPSRFA